MVDIPCRIEQKGGERGILRRGENPMRNTNLTGIRIFCFLPEDKERYVAYKNNGQAAKKNFSHFFHSVRVAIGHTFPNVMPSKTGVTTIQASIIIHLDFLCVLRKSAYSRYSAFLVSS